MVKIFKNFIIDTFSEFRITMKVFVSFFILISLFHHSYSQDSIKIKSKIILNVQRWPESRYSISTMKVDKR